MACRGLLCNIEVGASFSKFGFNLEGTLTASGDPNFFLPTAEIAVEGCVGLTFGCPSRICKRKVLRDRLAISLSEVCIKAGKRVLPCQLEEFDECEQAGVAGVQSFFLGKCPKRHTFLQVHPSAWCCTLHLSQVPTSELVAFAHVAKS